MATPKSGVVEEMERIQAELLQLDLEEKREAAAKRRSDRDQRTSRARDVEQGLAIARAEQRGREQACPHKKGGTDLEGLFLGNNANYAVIKHVHAGGEVMVVCQRCGAKWERPVRLEFGEDIHAYAEAVREYQRAVAFPTDNITSGTQLFTTDRAA